MFSVSLQVSGSAGSSATTPACRPRNCGHWSLADTPVRASMNPAAATTARFTRLSLSRNQALADLGDDREVRIDDVGDFVFECLSHERVGAAFGEAVIGNQPFLHFAGRVLKRFEQRSRAAEHHDVGLVLETGPAD